MVAMQEQHGGRILFQRPAVAQVGQFRPLVLALRTFARQLRQRQHGDFQFTGKVLQVLADFRHLVRQVERP
ncbi:hypothetical protein MSKU3_3281 [Komagataeibacter oboediens]|nr:hypothetical protein MSKU3_3281 [Komagataeibacter oboediens]